MEVFTWDIDRGKLLVEEEFHLFLYVLICCALRKMSISHVCGAEQLEWKGGNLALNELNI